MELNEAIAHAKEVAENVRYNAYTFTENDLLDENCRQAKAECLECASEHEQLAEWLTELQERREADRWIPISERLPEDYTKVLITNEYGTVTCVIWNTWYQNEYTDAKKEYKAIAWKPVPKRYESEAENE